jgi:hypothetical protein
MLLVKANGSYGVVGGDVVVGDLVGRCCWFGRTLLLEAVDRFDVVVGRKRGTQNVTMVSLAAMSDVVVGDLVGRCCWKLLNVWMLLLEGKQEHKA